MYIYICNYVYIYVIMYLSIYIYVIMYIYIYVIMYIYIYLCRDQNCDIRCLGVSMVATKPKPFGTSARLE